MKYLLRTFLFVVGSVLLFSKPLRGQQIGRDSLLSASELKTELYKKNGSADSNRVFKASGIANIGSGQLHGTYLQIYLQDDSAGVSLFARTIDTPVSAGDSLVVTGTRQLYHGVPELRISDYEVYPQDTLTIEPVPLSKVIENPADYQGMKVEGEGVIREKGYQFNGKYMILADSDTSEKAIMVYVSNYHSRYGDFDFDTPDPGDRVSLTGVLGNYDPTYPDRMQYKVLLRTPDDFKHDGWPQYYLEYLAWILGGLTLLSAGWMISLRQQVKRKTRALQESLEEKEVLLKEIHHRVKNNLAGISGLLQLQSGTTQSKEVQNALEESQTRINSMMMVHDKLYRSTSLKDISMEKYLEDLAEGIYQTMAADTSNIDVKVDTDGIKLETDQVIPLGLLVNELLVNAFKHAFKERQEGEIQINLNESNGLITLKVEDNGVGLPENINLKESDSLGMLLIDTFSKQLDAQQTIKNTPGACFVFKFPARTE